MSNIQLKVTLLCVVVHNICRVILNNQCSYVGVIHLSNSEFWIQNSILIYLFAFQRLWDLLYFISVVSFTISYINLLNMIEIMTLSTFLEVPVILFGHFDGHCFSIKNVKYDYWDQKCVCVHVCLCKCTVVLICLKWENLVRSIFSNFFRA